MTQSVEIRFREHGTAVALQLGPAKNWDEALGLLFDHAEERFRESVAGQYNNFGQRRVLCMDKLLQSYGVEDPKTWRLDGTNSEDDDGPFRIWFDAPLTAKL